MYAPAGQKRAMTYLISALQIIDEKNQSLQVLVLTSGREQAISLSQLTNGLSEYGNIQSHCFIGGTSVRDNIRKSKRCQIAIGNLGRISDMVRRGALSLDTLKLLVIDEAFDLISSQHSAIFSLLELSGSVQEIWCTAKELPRSLTGRLRNPFVLKSNELEIDGTYPYQFKVYIEREEYRLDTLCDLTENMDDLPLIIYCKLRRQCDWLADRMMARNIVCCCLHGEMIQSERERIVKEFRSGSIRRIITLEPLLRGVILHHVHMIINFFPPRDYKQAALFSDKFRQVGFVISLVGPEDKSHFARVPYQIPELPSDYNSNQSYRRKYEMIVDDIAERFIMDSRWPSSIATGNIFKMLLSDRFTPPNP